MMRTTRTLFLVLLVLLTSAFGALKMPKPPFPAPEFTVSSPDLWLNSPPLSIKSQRGKVVLVDFWTFGCINCKRSIPWLRSLEKKYAERNFQLIGVHTPEFDHERERGNVVREASALGRRHPIVIDNNLTIWRAYKNRYWPAFYIIDKHGTVRGVFVGETHVNDNRARAIEGLIERLLGENA